MGFIDFYTFSRTAYTGRIFGRKSPLKWTYWQLYVYERATARMTSEERFNTYAEAVAFLKNKFGEKCLA